MATLKLLAFWAVNGLISPLISINNIFYAVTISHFEKLYLMKYFLHDSSAFDDEKISELFMCFGYEGLGLFYTILEKLAKQEKPVKTLVLKRQLKVGKKLDKCWEFMEEIDLISSNNGDTFNKQLLNFSEKYQIKKENNAKRISEWREKQSLIENVTHYEHVRNTPKVKESKVKESKVNSIYENYVFFDDAFRVVWDEFLSMRKGLRKPATDKAQILILNKLDKFRAKSMNPIDVVEQSIIKSWQDVFELQRPFLNGNQNGQEKGKMQNQFDAHEESKRILDKMK